MNKKIQILLIIGILLITVYGSLIKNNGLVSISGMILASIFIIFEAKNWKNLGSFFLIILISLGYFYNLEILKLGGFIFLFTNLYTSSKK